jgi:hypothetical protein
VHPIPQAADEMVIAHQSQYEEDFDSNTGAGTSFMAIARNASVVEHDGLRTRVFQYTITPWVVSGDELEPVSTMTLVRPMHIHGDVDSDTFFFNTRLDTLFAAHPSGIVDMYDIANSRAIKWDVPNMGNISAFEFLCDSLMLYDRSD